MNLLSDPIYSKMQICFAKYWQGSRKLVLVRDLCKIEEFLQSGSSPLEALQLYCIPNRTYLQFIFEHVIEHDVNTQTVTFSKIQRTDISDKAENLSTKTAFRFDNQIQESIKKFTRKLVKALGGSRNVFKIKVLYIIEFVH